MQVDPSEYWRHVAGAREPRQLVREHGLWLPEDGADWLLSREEGCPRSNNYDSVPLAVARFRALVKLGEAMR